MNKEDILKILEGAKDKSGDVPMCLVRQAFEKLPEPCTDTISRQAVLNMQYRIDDSATLSTRDVVNVDDIKDLPPVNPQPKTGKWIYKKDLKQFFCNKCGYPSLTDDDKYIYSMDLPNFCENCGAMMVEPLESEG